MSPKLPGQDIWASQGSRILNNLSSPDVLDLTKNWRMRVFGKSDSPENGLLLKQSQPISNIYIREDW